MAHEAGQKNPPPLKKRLRSTMIVGRKTNGIISWVVSFRFALCKSLLERRTNNDLLIYLIYTQQACGARVASVRLKYTRERENVFIVIARACIAYLSRSTHSVT